MTANDLLTYDQATQLVNTAGIRATARSVRTYIWAHPHLCPVESQGYHFKRVRRRHVELLIRRLKQCGKGRVKFPARKA